MRRRRFSALLALLLSVCPASSVWGAQASPQQTWGALDSGFYQPNGFAAYLVGSGKRDRAIEVKLDAAGRLVVAGYTHNGKDNDLLVMRLLADGTLDAGFGDGQGYVIHGGSGDQMALGLALQDDGKIVVTGRTSPQGNNEALTLRFNGDGSLDASFGDQGAVVFSGKGGGTDTGRAVAVQPDGKILVAGETSTGAEKNAFALRYMPNGAPDTTFGQAGLATYAGSGKADDWAFDIAVQADGRIVVTGGITTGKTEDIMLWRLTAEGVTDQGFGSGGVVSWAGPGGLADYGNAMAVDRQGRILVAGADHDGANYNIVLLAFLADGRLDASFGQDGVATYQSAYGNYDYAWGVAVTGDGRILVAGTSTDSHGETPTILCYLPDGSLDKSFANQGVFKLDASGATGRAYDVTLANDGSVVGAGYLTSGGRDEVLIFRLTGR